MRSLPSLVHGAGSSSSRFSRYLQTKKPDFPFSGQYFTTLRKADISYSTLNTSHQPLSDRCNSSFFPSCLVDSVVSISFLGSVFAVLPTFAAAHNPNGFAILPVFCFCSNFVIDGNVTVKSQSATKTQHLHVSKGKVSLHSKDCDTIPVHVSKCLITWLLGCPFVAWKISAPRTSVSEFITIILETQ